jgi:hypothetical protein
MADNSDKAFKDDQARIARENEEQVAKADGLQPTPTQEENDRAKLGVSSLEQLDNKEDDGSGEDRAALTYSTRDAAPAKRSK